MGGAHRAPEEAMAAVRAAIATALAPLAGLDGATLRSRRRQKFLDMGREALA
jgi:acetyl-CoA carboxylase carboxyl transferase subunit alpha